MTEDIERVAATGTMICHNASSNLRIRSGVASLNHWTARGVRVVLGLDEASINDDRDILQEMRVVLRDGKSTRVNKAEVLEALAASSRVP